MTNGMAVLGMEELSFTVCVEGVGGRLLLRCMRRGGVMMFTATLGRVFLLLLGVMLVVPEVMGAEVMVLGVRVVGTFVAGLAATR